jgi:hypothetical protein
MKKRDARPEVIVITSIPLWGSNFAFEYRERAVISVHDWEENFAPPPVKVYIVYQLAYIAAVMAGDATRTRSGGAFESGQDVISATLVRKVTTRTDPSRSLAEWDIRLHLSLGFRTRGLIVVAGIYQNYVFIPGKVEFPQDLLNTRSLFGREVDDNLDGGARIAGLSVDFGLFL